MRIELKIHCRSSIQEVFGFLNTAEGRSKFWAESAEQVGDLIHFRFPNGQEYKSKIYESTPYYSLSVDYFNSSVNFILDESGNGGTDLKLINEGVDENDLCEINSGWVSVLMSLKAAVDFNVDLRNHDSSRTWDDGFVDN